MLTCCERQGTNLRLAEKISRMFISINGAPKNVSGTRLQTTPNPTRIQKQPISRSVWVTFSERSSGVLVVLSFRIIWFLMHNAQKERRKDPPPGLGPAPLSIRHLTLVISFNYIRTGRMSCNLKLQIMAAHFVLGLIMYIWTKRIQLGKFDLSLFCRRFFVRACILLRCHRKC